MHGRSSMTLYMVDHGEGFAVKAPPSVQSAIVLLLALIPTIIAVVAMLFLSYASIRAATPTWFICMWLALAGAAFLLGVFVSKSAISRLRARELTVHSGARRCIYKCGSRSIALSFSDISRIELCLEQITRSNSRSIAGAWMAWLSIWTVNEKRLVLSNEPALAQTREAATSALLDIGHELSQSVGATVSITNGRCPSAYLLNSYARRILGEATRGKREERG